MITENRYKSTELAIGMIELCAALYREPLTENQKRWVGLIRAHLLKYKTISYRQRRTLDSIATKVWGEAGYQEFWEDLELREAEIEADPPKDI